MNAEIDAIPTHAMDGYIDAYRIDGATTAMRCPYRCQVRGIGMLVTKDQRPRKFRTLAEAIAAGKRAMEGMQ